MVTGRSELRLVDTTDNDTIYQLPIAVDENGAKLISIQPVPWEPGDPKQEWRVPLHPWDFGISHNRIEYDVNFNGQLVDRPSRTYAKSNADLSWPGVLVPPPLLTSLTFQSQAVSSFLFAAGNMTYNAAPGTVYGAKTIGTWAAAPGDNEATGPYYAAATAAGAVFYKGAREFNGKIYVFGSQYIYSIDPSYTVTLTKDFGNGKTVYDIEVYNNELVVAMGETEKLWTMTAAEAFTQATDATYAIALGVVGEYLWRAESTNKLSNCITAPLTLTSWAPAATSQYPAGDSTFSITDILEYNGFAVATKPNGVFFPDGETKFHNQTPQLATYPHRDNCKGAFTAGGYLWVPSVAGLLRVSQGESIPLGPELSGRPDYRFWVRGGVEWAGDIYLLCTDEAASSQTAIFKMQQKGNTVIFHELARTGSVLRGYFIIVSAIFTNPSCLFGLGEAGIYFKLGRGGGRHLDDPNYAYGTSWESEHGDFIPGPDLAIVTTLVGVEVVAKVNSSEEITVAYQYNQAGSYTSMLTTAEGSGTAPITGTSSTRTYTSAKRYADVNTTGQILQLKLSGTNASGLLGTDRPEVRELWAFGFSHPSTTDIITLGIYADRNAMVRGKRVGLTSGAMLKALKDFQEQQTVLTMQLADYEETRTTRVRIVGAQTENISTVEEGSNKQVRTDIITVILKRVDYASAYAD